MPIVKIITNISQSQLPVNFLDKLVPTIAQAIRKHPEKVVCALLSDTLVWFEGDITRSPGASISIESIGHISPHENLSVTQVLTEYFHKELAIKPSRLVITFHDMKPSNIGKGGITLNNIYK